MSRTEHPGSTGGWDSTFVEYEILGRVKRQSVPTETKSSYTPAGDDSAAAVLGPESRRRRRSKLEQARRSSGRGVSMSRKMKRIRESGENGKPRTSSGRAY